MYVYMYLSMYMQVLLPYEGNLPPKITFIGFGGITEPTR